MLAQLVAAAKPQPSPAPIPGLTPEHAEFLTSISFPLASYMHDDGVGGAEFASWVSSGYGAPVFDSVAKLGDDILVKVITNFPATAHRLQGVHPARIASFVKEFCAATPGAEDEDQQEPGPGLKGA